MDNNSFDIYNEIGIDDSINNDIFVTFNIYNKIGTKSMLSHTLIKSYKPCNLQNLRFLFRPHLR
jgi:hypothetical protein